MNRRNDSEASQYSRNVGPPHRRRSCPLDISVLCGAHIRVKRCCRIDVYQSLRGSTAEQRGARTPDTLGQCGDRGVIPGSWSGQPPGGHLGSMPQKLFSVATDEFGQ